MNFLHYCRKLCNYRRQSVLPELPPKQPQSKFDPAELANNPTIETANRYKQALESERQRYQDWLKSQVCRHCKAPFGSKYGWLHEDLCRECADNPSLPYTGSARAAYLTKTGNTLT